MWVIFEIPLYYGWGVYNQGTFWLSGVIALPVMLLPMYLANKKLAKSYATLIIGLDESGVEMEADIMAYKKILWKNLMIKEKSNGVIYLYDKSRNKILRWWTGSGVIIIQSEILDRDDLLMQLNSHVNN